MKVLGIIPARGGSKGIPRKNMRLLNGKPLIAYTVESALEAKRLDRVILSTEDEEIAETGLSLGVDVPFMRPVNLLVMRPQLFLWSSTQLSKWKVPEKVLDAVCLLQPTNPLRRSEDIDACIDVLESTRADSVISVLKVPHQYNPKWVYWQNEDGELALSTGEVEPVTRRQDLPPAFHREGSIYVTRRNVLDEFGNLYGTRVQGYELDPQQCVNIDTDEDWALAESMLNLDTALASAN